MILVLVLVHKNITVTQSINLVTSS